MTVYVDDARIVARVGRLQAQWSHLTADDRDELHAFAAGLGLRRSWFQDHESRWHYDVTDSKRGQAVRAGAVELPARELAVLCRRRAGRPAPGVDSVESGDEADAGRELAALVRGPLDRRWYWRDELEAVQAAARRDYDRVAGLPAESRPTWSPASVLAYAPTEHWVDNPLRRYGRGRVWIHADAQMHTSDTREGVA